MRSARSSRRSLASGVAAAFLLIAPVAWAQQTDVEVMVSHISDQACERDPRAAKLDGKLREQFRYECLKVLDSKKLALALDEVGTVRLPGGKLLQVRPLDVGDNGVLLAVSVEGAVNTDLRVRSGHLVAIGAGAHDDGKLIVSLEPRY